MANENETKPLFVGKDLIKDKSVLEFVLNHPNNQGKDTIKLIVINTGSKGATARIENNDGLLIQLSHAGKVRLENKDELVVGRDAIVLEETLVPRKEKEKTTNRGSGCTYGTRFY